MRPLSLDNLMIREVNVLLLEGYLCLWRDASLDTQNNNPLSVFPIAVLTSLLDR